MGVTATLVTDRQIANRQTNAQTNRQIDRQTAELSSLFAFGVRNVTKNLVFQ